MTVQHPNATKVNRTIQADLFALLEVARRLSNGRIELEPIEVHHSGSPIRHPRVRAMLMHDGEGIALQGVGKNATDAVGELKDVIDVMIATNDARVGKDSL